MTVKELADFCGKTERCIRNWIGKAAEKSSEVKEKSSAAGHGKVVDYTIDEVEVILGASTLPKAVVDEYVSSARAANTQGTCAKSGTPTMTIQELVSFTGKSERCVRGWISKAGIKTPYAEIAQGIRHGYTIDEVEAILGASSMSRDAVSILMQNARDGIAGNGAQVSLPGGQGSLERAFEMMARAFETIAETQRMQEDRLQKSEGRIREREAVLPAPQIKPRDRINMLVRSYASASGVPYRDCWNELYRQFSYRTNTNPKKCAENRGMGILDYIETEGQIGTLEAVAAELCGA